MDYINRKIEKSNFLAIQTPFNAIFMKTSVQLLNTIYEVYREKWFRP